MVVGKIEQRIKKMKEAIETEAKQRALHIVERADDEANIERIKIMKEEKEKIDEEFSKLNKNQKVKAKIEKSSVVNHQRIRKMEERYRLVQELKTELKDKLSKIVCNESTNKELVGKLVVQGLLRMMERNVSIEVSKSQQSLVSGILRQCEAQFSKIMKQQTNQDMSVILKLSDYSLEDKSKNIIGGVFLRSNDGLIVCDNSLDARVDLIFEHLLPQIRSLLFPVK